MASRSGQRRRFSAIAADQAVAGASNVLVAVLAARSLDIAAFGKFEIVFLVYALVQAAARALVGEPLLIHPEEVEAGPREALESGLWSGLGAGVVVALAGVVTWLLITPDLGQSLLLLAALLPLLVLQDLGRFLSFALKTPGFALFIDLIWLIGMIVVVTVLASVTTMTVHLLVLSWAGTGAVAAVPVLVRHRWLPVHSSLRWLRSTWRFAWRYLVMSCVANGSALLATIAVAALAGPAAAGALRGAQLLIRPYITVQTAAVTAGTAEVARVGAETTEVRRQARRLSTFMTIVAVVLGAAIVLIPDPVGRALLGDTWSQAEPLLVIAAAQVLVLGPWTGPRAGLLGTRQVRATFRLTLVLSPLLVVAAAVGSLGGDIVVAYWVIVAAQAVITASWWLRFRQLSRQP